MEGFERKREILERMVAINGERTAALLDQRIEENRVVLENLRAVGASQNVLYDVEKQYNDSKFLREAYEALKGEL
ncbi:hypothetical protein [Tumebacillus flagellatus]|uniref:Uncharacterized protein n=1 Tax=Tumebacillus flagellatus TaxID=1157490 RepID=A0A074LW37_9BACL|nr:hypothetical protein [Tumebacillus flagellatus]KEO84258.1 hypothetical protein EL26_05695 [Tumebacillus flagellatus]